MWFKTYVECLTISAGVRLLIRGAFYVLTGHNLSALWRKNFASCTQPFPCKFSLAIWVSRANLHGPCAKFFTLPCERYTPLLKH